MTIENTYIIDRNLKTIVGQLEEIKELLAGNSSEETGNDSTNENTPAIED